MSEINFVEYLSLTIAFISILGTAASVGVVFGTFRGRIKQNENNLYNYKEFNEKSINVLEKDIDNLETKVNSTNKTNQMQDKLIEEKSENLRNYVDTEFKSVNHEIQDIQRQCVCRKNNVDMVPALAEKVKKLEIDVGVLPSKLSEELSKAFSEEYKKLVSTLADKDK